MIALLMLAAALDCNPVAGDRILGRDLAAASPAFARLSPEVVIGFAPRPGVRRFLDVAELRRIARSNQIEVQDFAPVCFERPTTVLKPDQLMPALRDALGDPEARIDIVDLARYPVPDGKFVFPRKWLGAARDGDSAVWNGYVQYEGGRSPIWVRARIRTRQRRLAAVSDLMPGVPVDPKKLRVEEVFEFPESSDPAPSPEAAAGRVPRHLVPAGKALKTADLEDPIEVGMGDLVRVEVRSGAAVLSFEAKAESAGRRGELVSVRNAASGKVFRAKVEGKGSVLVECRNGTEYR